MDTSSKHTIRTLQASNGLNGQITVSDYNGRYYLPSLTYDPLESLKTTEFLDGDVIICSYPKSGYHWVWEIANMLLNNSVTVSSLIPGQYMLDMRPRRRLLKLKSPRVMGTHSHFEQLPDSVKQKRCKLINIVRDPRAALVSGYNFYSKFKEFKWQGNWNGYLDLAVKGQIPWNDWFSHTQSWERMRLNNSYNIPVHLLFYEDLLQDPFSEIRRLSNFLKTDSSDDLIRNIVEATSLRKLKEEKSVVLNSHRTFSTLFENNEQVFYRKGIIDDWKSYFSVEQNEKFLKLYQQMMKGFRITLKSLITPHALETGCVNMEGRPKL